MGSFIDLQDYADSTGQSDAAPGLLVAAQKARDDGLRIIGSGVYRLDSLVDLRGVNIDMSSATFNINHSSDVGIIIGGDAYASINPPQSLGYIALQDDKADMFCVQIRGSKSQHIYIQRAASVQLYADGDIKSDGSTAYSTMTLVRVDKVELSGVNGGWINENQFFLNRTLEVRVLGDYSHNHNKFHAGTMETNGIIDLQTGHCNSFSGLRFERTAEQVLSISFGEKTFANDIEATWQHAVTYTNIPIDSHDNIIILKDQGLQNTVRHSQETVSDEVCLLELSEGTPRLSSYTAPSYRHRAFATDIYGLYSIEQRLDRRYKILGNYSLIFESDLIAVGVGDQIVFDSETTSDEYPNALRPHLYAYDENRNLITGTDFGHSSPVSGSGLKWYDKNSYFSPDSNLHTGHINILKNTSMKYIRICLASGNDSSDLVLNYLRLVYRKFKRMTPSIREHHHIHGTKNVQTIVYDEPINMLKVGKDILCYSKDMSQLKINICRSEHYVVSISGNIVTLDETPDFTYGASSEAKLVYQDLETGEPEDLNISGINATVVTLSKTPPKDIFVGSAVSVIVTKEK